MKKTSAIPLTLLVLASSVRNAAAIEIENKSPHPALVTITDTDFKVVEKFRMDPQSTYEFPGDGDKTTEYNIEAFVLDPQDATGVPTFFHLVKGKDKVCLPQHLCIRAKKKK